MDVVGVTRSGRDATRTTSELRALLPGADVVVLLAPRTAQTRGMVNAGFLGAMPPGALLVNAGRGGLVDTDALLAALRHGRLRAALDVTDPEPLPPGHPLWEAPGLLVTPHHAGDTRRADERAADIVEDQLRRLARGEPLRNVIR